MQKTSVLPVADRRFLRSAAFQMQYNPDDFVKIAGIVRSIKNWWKAKFDKDFAERQKQVQESYTEIKKPLSDLIHQLQDMDTAFKAQDLDTVAKLVATIPATIAGVTHDMGDLSTKMRAADAAIPVSYFDENGNELSGDNLRYVQQGYKKNKDLVEKLWELLPDQFKEIPIGQRINRPITDFSWFSNYNPSQIEISGTVYNRFKQELETNLAKYFDREAIDYIIGLGYDDFIDNLKTAILSSSILLQVNFPGISQKITRRTANQMEVDVQPGYVSLPVGKVELQIYIPLVKLHDLGASVVPTPKMTVFFGRTPQLSTESIEELKRAQSVQAGEITRIVKKAIIRNKLPLTETVIKIQAEKFHDKVKFSSILCGALREELDAECSVRHQGEDVEIQANLYGTKIAGLSAIYGISMYLADEFQHGTKLGVTFRVEPGVSKLEIIEPEILDKASRQVLFDYWSVV